MTPTEETMKNAVKILEEIRSKATLTVTGKIARANDLQPYTSIGDAESLDLKENSLILKDRYSNPFSIALETIESVNNKAFSLLAILTVVEPPPAELEYYPPEISTTLFRAYYWKDPDDNIFPSNTASGEA